MPVEAILDSLACRLVGSTRSSHRIAAPKQREASTLFEFDPQYVRKLVDGHSDTIRHFEAYFMPRIRAKVHMYSRLSDFAEDVARETFARVYQRLQADGGLDRAEALGAFVLVTCRNVMSEMDRAERRTVPMPEEGIDRPDPAVDAQTRLEKEEIESQVRKMLHQLRPRDRNVLYALYYEEKSRDEVCAEFEMSRDNLRLVLCRALDRFRPLVLANQQAGRDRH